MSDERLAIIEKDIKQINGNVAKLYTLLNGVTTGDLVWRETMCAKHTGEIKELRDDVDEIKPKVASKWPALIASFAGATFSGVLIIGALYAMFKGEGP